MNDIMKFFGQQVSAESFDQIKISIDSFLVIRRGQKAGDD